MKEIKFLLIGLFFITACKTAKMPTVKPVQVQYKERVVERLVPIEMPGDSSAIQALFECDSLNNVIMKELTEEKTKRVESKVSFSDGLLSYKTIVKRDKAYLPSKDSIVYQEVPVEVPVPVEVNKLTKWQKMQINAGRLFLTLLVAALIYFGFKYRTWIIKPLVYIIGKWLGLKR